MTFRWVRVGDGGLEPAAIKTVDGVRMAFTIGCPDGFPLGRGSAVKLCSIIERDYDDLNEAETEREEKLAARRQRHFSKMNPNHGYAGFGR